MNKKVKSTLLLSTIISSILPTPSHANEGEYIKIGTEPNESDAEVVTVSFVNNSSNPDIILRVGEFPNKPGKRLIVNPNEDYNGLPIRYDKEHDNYYVCEYDFNLRIAESLHAYLKSNGVNSVLQTTKDKSEDLNSAGRIAKAKHPTLYLSIHTNSYDSNSTGYFFMTNVNDTESSKTAQRFSYALEGNKLVPRRENRRNVNSYIGELNQEPGRINILGEFGFALSNKEEARNVSSDEFVNYIARHLGDEIISVLNELNNK